MLQIAICFDDKRRQIQLLDFIACDNDIRDKYGELVKHLRKIGEGGDFVDTFSITILKRCYATKESKK